MPAISASLRFVGDRFTDAALQFEFAQAGSEAGGNRLPFLKAKFVGDLQASAGEGDF